MHALIGLAIAACTLIFWLGRAARGAGDIADAANTISNIPRKRRYLKESRKSGLALITQPVEAAVVLMITTAKISEMGRISEAAEAEIKNQLCHFGQTEDGADGLFRQISSLMYDMIIPENALFPMVDLLQKEIDLHQARDIVDMMNAVAAADDGPNSQQKEFIRRYSERMNLL